MSDSQEPLISVLMTSYNRERYIGSAIESVLSSTYHNWELLIVDDGSTDNTIAIARSYEDGDKRIKVYVNEKNLGDYPNRNKAASLARGKYVKYVDSDDMIYSHGLEHLVTYMERFPNAGYGLCTIPQDDKQIFPFELSPSEAYRRHYFQQALFVKAPLSAIIRRSVFEESGGFKNKRMVGDFEMWHRLSLHYPVVLMPQGIIWYRKHDGQEMTDYDNYRMDYVAVSEAMINSSQCPLSWPERKSALRKLRNYKLSLLFRYARGIRIANCYQVLKAF